MRYEYAVIGGDERQGYLAEFLAGSHRVIACGLCRVPESVPEEVSLERAIRQADCILAPVPLTSDGTTLYALKKTEETKAMTIGAMFQELTPSHRVYAGGIPREWMLLARRRQLHLTDYMKIEEIAWRNAVSTAEGTLAEAIGRCPDHIEGSRCLILGFGRCGMAIARLFARLGAKITVCARRRDVLCQGEMYGYEMRQIRDMEEVLSCQDLIINTIPARVLGREQLEKISPQTEILDIAGQGGGTDFAEASRLGRSAVLCPGLPGKYSPRASARILADWLENEQNAIK